MASEITYVHRKTPSQILDEMTLFDDDLMSKVFDNNIEAANLLLRIILNQDDIEVISVEGQKELENPLVDGRNICLDIFAQDSSGKYHDIEVQRRNAGAGAQRARFHSAMLDSRMLKQTAIFRDIADSYVIFITEKDVLGFGDPVYQIDRTIRGHEVLFGDGSHILYVNGQYHGNDPIGKLIHDFRCKNPEEMFYEPLSRSVKHFKASEGGRAVMCEAVKEYGEAVRLEFLITNIKNMMLNGGFTFDQAVKLLGLSDHDIRQAAPYFPEKTV